jgi:tRNA(adenine34) deaminase
MEHPDRAFMTRAIELAGKGEAGGEYRLGALIVHRHEIIAEAYTALTETADPTAHAEVLAIRSAARAMGSRYLPDCFLYSTLEPCPMCTSAVIWAKMAGIVFGASLEDALSCQGEWRDGRFYSWRQIKIKSRYVISRGLPVVRLCEEFMRPECLSLLPASERA